MTAADPGRFLLDKIDAREQALTREAGQAQARIDELTARLRELEEAISAPADHRKTLISLAGHDDGQPAAEPAGPPPAVPDHPAYQQILTAFADLRRPLRARDLCLALDLPVAAKNTENIRSKLQAPGQPRHPRRDRTRIVRSATSTARPAALQPGRLIQPSRRKGHQLAKRPLSAR